MADRDPDRIEQEIEGELEALARNIDAIADRVSPSNVVHRTGDRVREELHQVAATIGSIVTPGDEEGSPLTDEQRKRALVIGGVVLVGVALLVLRARRGRG
ncbi:DUF3618 domain-containing protein [Actinocorallia populi]|uniref:DUF3618 domain-containing protein n=1 Tax=Actinocorallia populi TaxID=2079200 RepID=UPI000D0931EF|nr:DUF3618 domain-containing protein [Actinocorallia populi]